MRDHNKLSAFELADELAVLIYKMTRGFPKEEIYGLVSQMRRAATSVNNCKSKLVEAEKVLGSLVRTMR
jgi:four helix bundle protein